MKGKDKIYHKNLVKSCHEEQINFTQSCSEAKQQKIAESAELVELVDQLTEQGWKKIDKEYAEIRKLNPNDNFYTASLEENKGKIGTRNCNAMRGADYEFCIPMKAYLTILTLISRTVFKRKMRTYVRKDL